MADSGGAKDHLPLTMAPGTQGPQPSVCEMPQSSGVLMVDHARVSWHAHWVDDLRGLLCYLKIRSGLWPPAVPTGTQCL